MRWTKKLEDYGKEEPTADLNALKAGKEENDSNRFTKDTEEKEQ